MPVSFVLALGTRKATHEPLRIVSWNILADEYAKPEKYPDTATHDLDWTTRSERILHKIETFDADIVCLQEVQLSHWPDFASSCTMLGYNCDLLQNVTRKHPVAMAILYRPETAQVLAVESRSRALLAALRLSKTQEILFLANVHFQAGKNGMAEETRYFQIRSLLKRIEIHASQLSHSLLASNDKPNVLILGDFNMDRTSQMYRLLSTGKVPAEHDSSNLRKSDVCQKQSHELPFLPLIDVYRRSKEPRSSSPTKQSPTFRTGCVLDYIFTSSSIQTVPWQIAERLSPRIIKQPTGTGRRLSRQDRSHAWPSAEHPSDHMPIGVELQRIGFDNAE